MIEYMRPTASLNLVLVGSGHYAADQTSLSGPLYTTIFYTSQISVYDDAPLDDRDRVGRP